MKEGWKYSKLDSVCIKTRNIKWNEVDSSHKYIDLTSVDRDSSCIFGTDIINSSNAPSRAKQIVLKGDVIFATTRPTLKRLTVIDDNYDGEICSTGFCILRHNESVLPKWIFYNLKSDKFYSYIEPLQTGANYPAVSDKIVKAYEIPVPPLTDQQRIVSYLDTSFAKIDALAKEAEESVENAKALFQATLMELMEKKEGWEENDLQYLCNKISDGTHHSPVNTPEGDYKYITAKNIRISGLDLTNITYVSKDIHEEIFARCNPEKGDVLYIKDGATTGIAIVNPLEEQFSLLSSVALLKPNRDLLNESYLSYALNSPFIYEQARSQMDGAAITRVTLKKIKSFIISYPPLSEQKQIVITLDTLSQKITQLQSNYESTLANCKALKQALLREVFDGR